MVAVNERGYEQTSAWHKVQKVDTKQPSAQQPTKKAKEAMD